MNSHLTSVALGEDFHSDRHAFLIIRLEAAENCANLVICHAYLNGIRVASASACESFVEGHSTNFQTLTLPVPAGCIAKVERDDSSSEAGKIEIHAVAF